MFERMYARNLTILADVEKKDISWFWEPYIPYGGVTILHGEPGVGKSMMAARLAAYCSNKQRISKCGVTMNEPEHVLYLTDEERLEDHVLPRMSKSGADLEKVLVVNDTVPITLVDHSLDNIVADYGVKLLIIDPIQEYLESNDGMANDFRSYPIIRKLADLARKSGCAVVLISNTDGLVGCNEYSWDDMYRDCVESILYLKDDPVLAENEKTLIHEKNNLGVEGESIYYEMTGSQGLY